MTSRRSLEKKHTVQRFFSSLHERPSAIYTLIVTIFILLAEVSIFNLGTWISPSSSESSVCSLSSCSYTLTNARISNKKTTHASIVLKDFDARLTIPIQSSTRVSTIAFTPSSAHATAYTIAANIGSKQIDIATDKSTFVFLPSDVSSEIAQSGHITISFLQGSRSNALDAKSTPTTLNLSTITINAHKPLEINYLRILFLLLVAEFLWAMRPNSKIYSIQLNPHSTRQKWAFWLAIVLPFAAIGIIASCIAGIFVGDDTWAETNNYVYSYHHYILASQGILEGHPWVNLPVDSTFDNLSNPYDPQLRNTAINHGAKIYWDYVFFNHRWYSYFGVLPSLLVYIPFHALTGRWPSIFAVTMPLLMVAIIMMMAVTVRFIARYFPEASVGHTIIAMINVFIATNFISLVLVTNLYTLAFASALCVVTIGLFFWLKVSSLQSKISNYWHMGLGSLFIALSTACRPTFIFTAVLVLPIFCELIFKKPLRFITASTLTSVCSALLGMLPALWYNWWRFGSITDFGAQYQVTVTDMRDLHASALATLQGAAIYLFQPLQSSTNPPYIESPAIFTSTWIHRETIICGFFVFAPLILLSILATLFPHIRERIAQKFMWIYPLLGTLVGLFLCVFVTRSGGIAWRYFVDFTWALTFAALPAFMTLQIRAHAARQTVRGKILAWGILLLTQYEIFILLASVFVPNRFASLTEYGPSLYAVVSQAMTILP